MGNDASVRSVSSAKPSERGAVLITGASSGIGRATALWLDARGHRVFAGVRKTADAAALRSESSDSLVPVEIDVTDDASITAAVGLVRSELRAPNELLAIINNAGMALTSPMEFIDMDALRQQFEVNVFGVANVTHQLLPLLQRPGGRVVNVSSGAGQIVTPLLGAYSASKYALEAMSDALRMELRSQGIAVSLIVPGFIASPIHEKNEKRTNEMLASLSQAGRERYGAAIEKLNENTARMARGAAPAESVAAAIERALTARRPRSRYPVTREAHLLKYLGPFLGDRMRDALFTRMVGLG